MMSSFARLRCRAVSLSVFVVGCVVCAAPAAAQSLGLVPAEVREGFTPGEPLRFDLSVANDGDVPVAMRTSVLDLWFNAKNEKVFGPPGSEPRSASDWIEFVPRDFTVPANGTGTVKVVITPPADARGGYYAVIFVESQPQLSQETSNGRPVYTNIRLGALVLLSSKGTETYAIDVGGVSLTPPVTNRPLQIDINVKNSGNTHIFPQAKVAILGADKRVVAKAEGEAKRLFPDQTDTLTLTWPGTLPPGEYVALLTLTYGNDKVYTRELPFVVQAPGLQAQDVASDR